MSDLFSGKLAQLLKIAREQNKEAFVDPSMAGGAAGGAPPMDPMMGGGAPPMDPMMGGGGAPPMDPMMGGMDPMMGGMPPMDPMMGGGAPPAGGGGDSEGIRAIIKEELAASGLTGAGGSSQNADGKIKPKIDVNVELLQIKKMLARLSDALGVNIPAADMVATEDDLTQMASGGAEAGGGAMTPGAIPPIDPMQGAMPEPKAAGRLEDTLDNLSDRASAMAHVMSRQRA